jgi:hypothetical protein
VPDASTTLVTIATFDAEFAAEAVANALRARGVNAQVLGGQMAGFRAEAPGSARVVVLRKEVLKARLALQELRHEMGQIDWSTVRWQAVQDADAPHESDMEPAPGTPPSQPGKPRQPGNPPRVRRLRIARDDDAPTPPRSASATTQAAQAALAGHATRAAKPILIAIIAAATLVAALVLLRAPVRVALFAGLAIVLMTVLVRVFVVLLRPRVGR